MSMPGKTARAVPVSAFLLIVTAGWTVNLAFTMIAPILPQIAAHGGDAHGAELAAELVMTIAGLGIIFGGIVSGPLQDWLGTRKVILLSVLLTGLAGSAGFVVHDLVLLGISRALLGFFGACGIATITALVPELYEEHARGRILGYQGAVSGGFNITGTLLGGLVAIVLGWPYVFLLYGAFGIATFVLGLWGASDVTHHNEISEASLLSALRSAWPLLALGVGVLALSAAPLTQGTFILAADGVTDSGTRAIVLSAAALFQIVGAGLYGRIRERLSGGTVLQLGAASAGLGVIIIGMAPTAVIVAVGAALGGFAGGLLPTELLRRATEGPVHLRGRAIGLLHAAFFLGVLLNPIAVAPLRSLVGLRGAMELLGALAFVLAVIGFVVSRARRKVAVGAA